MAQRQKGQDWQKVLEEYSRRECTQAEFCRRKGLNPHTLSYHLSKRQRKQPFLPAIREEAGSPEIILELPSGMTVRIRS